jgi:hypothetical protein
MDPKLRGPSRARTIIGTIEMIAVAIVVVALLVLAVWFLFFAHDPLLH